MAEVKAEESKWDVNAPAGTPLKQIPIRTDEGTWMDVDVSPDGRTVAFSLLGDIYTMPIDGGTSTRIAEGLAWEVQPRFSPDGRRIAFVTDRGGGDNIWLMNAVTPGEPRRPNGRSSTTTTHARRRSWPTAGSRLRSARTASSRASPRIGIYGASCAAA